MPFFGIFGSLRGLFLDHCHAELNSVSNRARAKTVVVRSCRMERSDAIISRPRFWLRNFVEEDLEELALLMADPEFMRFSTTSPLTREQTARFLFDRVIAPARAGLPSLFPLVWRDGNRLLGYSGLFR